VVLRSCSSNATYRPDLEERLRLEDAKCLAQGVARDLEARRELRLGWQLVVDGKLTAEDLPPQVGGEEVRQLLGVPVWHGTTGDHGGPAVGRAARRARQRVAVVHPRVNTTAAHWG
jgi:hypothetical protein